MNYIQLPDEYDPQRAELARLIHEAIDKKTADEFRKAFDVAAQYAHDNFPYAPLDVDKVKLDLALSMLTTYLGIPE